jgi:hypothetical protein
MPLSLDYGGGVHVPDFGILDDDGGRLLIDAKYLSKTAKGVGVIVSKDGEYLHLDWCLIDQPWEYDPDLEAHIARSNLFGVVREQKVDGYYFANK